MSDETVCPGCAKEIEALREKVAAMTGAHEFNHGKYLVLCRQLAALTQERDTLNAALDAKITICGDTNLAAAQEQVALLREALAEALNEISDWGQYASEYFQGMHKLTEVVERFAKITAGETK